MSRRQPLAVFVVILYACLCVSSSFGQTQPGKAKTSKPANANTEAEAEAAQRRTIAISLLTSLADEAKNFKDQTRRARVQARAADALWDSEPERARELFRRAWDAASIADEEAAKARAESRKTSPDGPIIRTTLELRSEVLRLAAKRDKKLGDEFLKVLDEAAAKERDEAVADARRKGGNRIGASRRLELARRLVQDGEIERAMEFAAPALTEVSLDSIFFLSALREKNAQMADGAFNNLLALVSRAPAADANTVSGLSSYVLTPFVYVTFDPDGGANQNRGRGPTPPPDNIAPALRSTFLRVAAQILMQPSPAPEQDQTTSGRLGKYLVIKRLLPVYEQYEAELAAGLRTQMTALASYVPNQFQQGPNRALTVGLASEGEDEGDPYERMQERLDHTSRTDIRDAIYTDYAVALTGKGDPRAKDLIDKIENAELRKKVKAYTDFQLTEAAVQKKDATEIARLARSADLNSIQRVWAFTSAARIVMNAERSRASDLLEEALNESRRISGSDPDRPRALTPVALGLAEIDPVRSWEVVGEIVKSANSADGFTGEDSSISTRLQTQEMMVMSNANAPDFDLLTVFRLLSKADLLRAIQTAKGFTGETPRAVATLAIARSVLEKREQLASGPN
jgi:hypothetical protein